MNIYDGGCVTLRAGREQRYRPCALEPDEDERRERGRGRGIAHGTRTRLSLFFFVVPATTRCALPGTRRQGGVGASGENLCEQEG